MPYVGLLGEAGLAKEDVLGTLKTPPARYRRFIPPFNFSTDIALLEGKGVSGQAEEVRKVAQGKGSLKSGKMKYELDPEEVGDDLMAAFGTDTITETASFVITLNTNDYIDFTVDAGGAVSCQIAAGTYKMGASSAEAGTLCALIKTGMEGAAAGRTFTVTYSYSTKKMTIAVDAGHTFLLKFATGTNNAKTICLVLGFTKADSSDALNHTSDSTTAAFVMSHAFSRVQSALLPTYSWWQKNGVNYPQHVGCMLSKLEFDIKAGEFVLVDAEWMGLKYDSTGITQVAAYSGRQPFKFDMCVPSVGGAPVTDYDDLKITIDNQVAVEHVVGNSIYGSKVYSKGLKVNVSLSMIVENTTEWAKFIAGTASSFSVAMTSSELIKAGFPYSLSINIPVLQYSAAPFPIAKDLIKIVFTGVGVYSVANSYTILPTLVNGYGSAY